MKHIIDISSYQPHIDWATFVKKNPDVGAVAVKYSEGLHYINSQVVAQVGGAKKHGLPVLLYHYARPGSGSGKQQADYFLQGYHRFGGLLGGLYEPMLDLEWGLTPIKGPPLVLWLRQYFDRIKFVLGKRGLLYTFPAYWNEKVVHSSGLNESAIKYFETLPLWIAHWGVNTPQIPPPWHHWTAWQYTSKKTRSGISGHVDDSYLAGPVSELKLPKFNRVQIPVRRVCKR